MGKQCVEFKFDVDELALNNYESDVLRLALGPMIGDENFDQFIDFCFMVAKTIKVIKDTGVKIPEKIKIGRLDDSIEDKEQQFIFSEANSEFDMIFSSPLVYNPEDNTLSWVCEMV